MSAVIDNLGGTHRCAGLAIIDAYALTATCNVIGVDTITTEGIESGLADLMLGELGHEICVMAIVGAAYGNIGLAATPDDVKVIYLHETIVPGGGKAEHNLA